MHRCSLADTLTHFKCVIAPAFHKYAHYKLTSWHGVCAFVLRPSCFHIFCYKLSAFLCLNPFLISSLFFQRVLVSPPNENMRVKKERKKYRTKLARLFCSCHKFDSRCSRLQPHSNPTSGIIHFDALLGAERSLGLDNTSLKHNLSPTGSHFYQRAFSPAGKSETTYNNRWMQSNMSGSAGEVVLDEEKKTCILMEEGLRFISIVMNALKD